MTKRIGVRTAVARHTHAGHTPGSCSFCRGRSHLIAGDDVLKRGRRINLSPDPIDPSRRSDFSRSTWHLARVRSVEPIWLRRPRRTDSRYDNSQRYLRASNERQENVLVWCEERLHSLEGSRQIFRSDESTVLAVLRPCPSDHAHSEGKIAREMSDGARSTPLGHNDLSKSLKAALGRPWNDRLNAPGLSPRLNKLDSGHARVKAKTYRRPIMTSKLLLTPHRTQLRSNRWRYRSAQEAPKEPESPNSPRRSC